MSAESICIIVSVGRQGYVLHKRNGGASVWPTLTVHKFYLNWNIIIFIERFAIGISSYSSVVVSMFIKFFLRK